MAAIVIFTIRLLTRPTLVLFTQARAVVDHPAASKGIRVVTCPDIRWQRRDIKTVQLLAPCMAKAFAEAQGADDAFLVENGYITEGSSCNCYIVQADNTVVTRPLSNSILHGITRKALVRLAERARCDDRGAAVHPGRGAQRPRGVYQFGDDLCLAGDRG